MIYVLMAILFLATIILGVMIMSLWAELERVENILIAMVEKIDRRNKDEDAKKPTGAVVNTTRYDGKPKPTKSCGQIITPKSPAQVRFEQEEEFRKSIYGTNS